MAKDWQSWCSVAAIAEFLQRLADNWRRIEQTFGVQNQSVSAMQTGVTVQSPRNILPFALGERVGRLSTLAGTAERQTKFVR
jgi:hypothetical protein